jgi:PAS domain S-box-containing protein
LSLVAEPVLERATSLAAEPASARAARRFVHDSLLAAGRPEWVSSAELAVSELVTNAILHAHTPLRVEVRVTARDATVHVRDTSPRLPAQRHWGESATTGRGLSLVASLTVEYGVQVEAGGKSVWFRLDDSVVDAPPPERDVWDIAGVLEDDAARRRGVVARLEHLPVVLWLSSQQHQEAVLRELFLMRSESAEFVEATVDLAGAGRALAQLAAGVEEAMGRETEAGGDPSAAGGDPSAAGVATARLSSPAGLPEAMRAEPSAVPVTVDVVLDVSADGHSDFLALQDALDLGVRLGADDRMLIRPALPETVALRDWACEQVLAQVNGVAATPWSGAAHPRFVDPGHVRHTARLPRWDDAGVRASQRAVVAADDNNRIVAVSDPAAALLGWPAGELTGRRVVTIVPERLREAHVAGFTRHLTTGESHVIGVALELPVLRRDGVEIRCRFQIERIGAAAGRAVYLAWLSPLD